MNIFGYGGARKCTHGSHGNSFKMAAMLTLHVLFKLCQYCRNIAVALLVTAHYTIQINKLTTKQQTNKQTSNKQKINSYLSGYYSYLQLAIRPISSCLMRVAYAGLCRFIQALCRFMQVYAGRFMQVYAGLCRHMLASEHMLYFSVGH